MLALKDIDNGTKLKVKITYLLTREKVKNNLSLPFCGQTTPLASKLGTILHYAGFNFLFCLHYQCNMQQQVEDLNKHLK